VASTISQPSNSSINIGSVNPSYGLEIEIFLQETAGKPCIINRDMGSGKRKTYLLCLFYYKFRINKHFFGANQLSNFLDIGLYSAQYITKFINSSSYLAIVYKDFIISFRPDS